MIDYDNMQRDVKTRWPGVYARHYGDCQAPDQRCKCTPGYYAKVYDKSIKRYVASKVTKGSSAEARSWRRDTLAAIAAGASPHMPGLRVAQGSKRFLAGIEDGSIRNKKGRRYKPSAVRDYKGAFEGHINKTLGSQRMFDVQRRDVQSLVDKLVADGLSASRVRSVVTALRALWAWAISRDLVATSPVMHIALPALDEVPRDRIATPEELEKLLAALPIFDRVPFALAGYAGGRRAEIRALRWRDVDFEKNLIHWGRDANAQKSKAAARSFPIISMLRKILQQSYLAYGRPDPDALVRPGERGGQFSAEALLERARGRWEEVGLNPIGLHESRHTTASHLIAAGANLKVVKTLMGHSSIQVTVDRYGHLLPGDEKQAGLLLDAFQQKHKEAV